MPNILQNSWSSPGIRLDYYSTPFHELSLDIETKKYFTFGLRLELGVLFFTDSAPIDLGRLEGFYIKGGIRMLSIGNNFPKIK